MLARYRLTFQCPCSGYSPLQLGGASRSFRSPTAVIKRLTLTCSSNALPRPSTPGLDGSAGQIWQACDRSGTRSRIYKVVASGSIGVRCAWLDTEGRATGIDEGRLFRLRCCRDSSDGIPLAHVRVACLLRFTVDPLCLSTVISEFLLSPVSTIRPHRGSANRCAISCFCQSLIRKRSRSEADLVLAIPLLLWYAH